MELKARLVCPLIVPGRLPRLVAVRDSCAFCGKPVWRSHSSPSKIDIICTACLPAELAKEKAAGTAMQILSPSPQQIADIEAERNRSNN